ncbi:hypothetical protein SteCoe_34518 [Stentor coeruleus]|uniref:Uncharacterized protein n=1 Tax=Stentor coeruleus TaxID=5963 RepID=A0A1R2AUI1_9CILI|nr:hypothetical protein SteCoe_34518 [Stentor coeruleus]
MIVKNSMKNYNQNSRYQQFGIDKNLDLILQTAEKILNIQSLVYTLVDYGCSEGLNSRKIFSKIISQIENLTESSFLLFHNDLPYINWSGFFNIICSPELIFPKNVFTAAIGKSFIEQILPSNSVHFGYSSFAFHWLSEPIPKYTSLDFNHYNEQNLALALEHYTRILENRYKELVIGGHLIFLVAIFIDEEIGFVLQQNLFKKMHAKGIISEDEALNFRYPVYFLTFEQWDQVLEKFVGRFKINIKEMRNFENEKLVSGENDTEKFIENICDSIVCFMKDIYRHIFKDRENKEQMIEIVREEMIETFKEIGFDRFLRGKSTLCLALEKIN